MSERKRALDLLEQIKALQEENGASPESMVRAIAMQAAIFEKIEPAMWEFALEDARHGLNLAVPEKTN